MISLVEETFSDSRSMREASSTVGKAEKSSGFSMKSVTVKIRIARAKLAARPTSSTKAGTGRIIMMMIDISASASRIVGWNRGRDSDSVIAVPRGFSGQDWVFTQLRRALMDPW